PAKNSTADLVTPYAPGRIRTSDQQLRRLLLYPPELRARDGVTASWTTFTKIVTSGCCAQPIGDSPPRHTSGRERGRSQAPAPHTRGPQPASPAPRGRSEEHTSELQSR